jgi:hypothetical protein
MKTSTRIIILLVTLFVGNSHIFKSQAVAIDRRESLADLPLGNVHIEKSNVPLLLSEIAFKYSVPIGVEVSPDDNLLKEGHIIVQINGGTLKDVLDSVIAQVPIYTWDIEDEVINVFPRGNREPLLKALLETQLQTLSIEEKTNRFKFREMLTQRPELKSIFDDYGVTPENQIFGTRDVAVLGRGFSFTVSNMKVKSILNRVIKESETKYWIVNRSGPNKQYLLLNL